MALFEQPEKRDVIQGCCFQRSERYDGELGRFLSGGNTFQFRLTGVEVLRHASHSQSFVVPQKVFDMFLILRREVDWGI